LAFVLLSSFGLLAYRSGQLKGQPELDAVVSRESAFLLNNVVLVSALFTIFLGTIFPLLSEAIVGVQVSVGAPYFNSVTAPLFLFLVFLMGVGPMIAWRKASWDNLRRNFLWPCIVSLIVGMGLFIWQIRSFMPLLGFTLIAFVIFTILFDTWAAVRARHRIAGEGLFRALRTLVSRNQRRYAGLVVHLGVVLVVMGIVGSMSYSVEREATMQRGETLEVDPYTVRFDAISGSEQPTHFRVEGNFRVFNNGTDLGTMSPALKFYPSQKSPIGRAVHHMTLGSDLYLILSGFSELTQNQATLKVLVRPLVSWIWVGGLVMTLGTIIAIWPMRRKSEQ
jgi:cytochrome c-type biogenesis protein CcmF